MMPRLLLSLALFVLVASSALAQAPTRLETEYKLAVPPGQDAAVWKFLSTRYAADKVRALGAGWESALGEEVFEDRYFDDAARTLLRANAGLRHRRRFTDGQLTKQLVQVKLSGDKNGLLREEIKFKPVKEASATTPLAGLLRPADQARLDSVLALLHVRLADLRPALTLGQRRRRLYLRLDGNDFSTITLDSSYNVGAQRASFTEIEVELNEKRYTGASATERARMNTVLQGLRADLLRQFPGLKQDQRPKYNKLTALLAAAPAEKPARSGSDQGDLRFPLWLAALLAAGAGLAAARQLRKTA